jgi:hypothetical protein
MNSDLRFDGRPPRLGGADGGNGLHAGVLKGFGSAAWTRCEIMNATATYLSGSHRSLLTMRWKRT